MVNSFSKTPMCQLILWEKNILKKTEIEGMENNKKLYRLYYENI